MKRNLIIRAGVWIVLLLSLLLSQASAQNEIYIYNRINPNHPDGVVNKLSFSLESAYSSVTKAAGLPYVDRQTLSSELNWVAMDNLSWHNRVDILKEDTVRYQFASMITIYLTNPTTSEKPVNPDGVIGSPSLNIGGGLRLHNNGNTYKKTFLSAESIIPVAWYLSAFVGLNKYQEVEASDSDEYYGGVSIYLKPYTYENFSNPDCPDGSVAFSLSGGTSEFGSFGQIEFLIAPANSFTVKLLARSETFDPPFDKVHTASLGFSFYSGK